MGLGTAQIWTDASTWNSVPVSYGTGFHSDEGVHNSLYLINQLNLFASISVWEMSLGRKWVGPNWKLLF